MKTRNTAQMTDFDMAERPVHQRAASGRASVLRGGVFAGLAIFLGGCSSFGESAFSDPSKYELYNCQQLTSTRVTVNNRVVELERLMAKAETGAAGSVVSGLAYQTEYLASKADRDAIDGKLASNNCSASDPATAPAATPPAARRKR